MNARARDGKLSAIAQAQKHYQKGTQNDTNQNYPAHAVQPHPPAADAHP
jgi:hypothetical protein